MAEYTIREISDMFQLPSSTLRYYEDMGILTNIGRTASGNRIYKSFAHDLLFQNRWYEHFAIERVFFLRVRRNGTY